MLSDEIYEIRHNISKERFLVVVGRSVMFRNVIFYTKNSRNRGNCPCSKRITMNHRNLEQGGIVFGWVIQKVFMFLRLPELGLELWIYLQ